MKYAVAAFLIFVAAFVLLTNTGAMRWLIGLLAPAPY